LPVEKQIRASFPSASHQQFTHTPVIGGQQRVQGIADIIYDAQESRRMEAQAFARRNQTSDLFPSSHRPVICGDREVFEKLLQAPTHLRRAKDLHGFDKGRAFEMGSDTFHSMQTQEGRSLAMQKATSFKSRVVEANKH
jgi:hypothetical protein